MPHTTLPCPGIYACISTCSTQLQVRCKTSSTRFLLRSFLLVNQQIKCWVLFEVTAGERWSFRFWSSMKHNQKGSPQKNKNGVFPHESKPDFHRAAYSPLALNPCTVALTSSAPGSGTQIWQNYLFSVPMVKKLHSSLALVSLRGGGLCFCIWKNQC